MKRTLKEFQHLLNVEKEKNNPNPLKINLWETAIECFSQKGDN